MYAYVSTPTDNRVIRIADGDVPKPILTGIPKGATGNTGALIFTSPTTLMVLTGDAGNPAQAADPASLAGKLLRIEQPTTVDQAPQTTALSGLGAGGGLCTDSSDGSLYVTDRTPTADRLQRITKDSKVSTVWTWPDRPGVAGCAASDGTVLVNLVNTKQTVAVRLAPDTGAVTGDPEVHPSGPARACLGAAAVARRQRVGRHCEQDLRGSRETRRRGLPALPAGRLPAQQRRQHLTGCLRGPTRRGHQPGSVDLGCRGDLRRQGNLGDARGRRPRRGRRTRDAVPPVREQGCAGARGPQRVLPTSDRTRQSGRGSAAGALRRRVPEHRGRRTADKAGLAADVWGSLAPRLLVEELRRRSAALLSRAQRAGAIRDAVTPADVAAAVWAVRGVVQASRAGVGRP